MKQQRKLLFLWLNNPFFFCPTLKHEAILFYNCKEAETNKGIFAKSSQLLWKIFFILYLDLIIFNEGRLRVHSKSRYSKSWSTWKHISMSTVSKWSVTLKGLICWTISLCCMSVRSVFKRWINEINKIMVIQIASHFHSN